MQMQDYIAEIKLELTADLLHLEIPDETLAQVVNKAKREIQRYIDTTKFITVPYARCLDLGDFKVSSVSRIYRAQADVALDETSSISNVDPMEAVQWQMYAGVGGVDMYDVSRWLINYASWNTVDQIRNTMSTDLEFIFDKSKNKIYINTSLGTPSMITIEYVPVYEDVSEITSDYWIDILMRMSVALTKVVLGRVRTKYRQSGALWDIASDGDKLLEEGNSELESLREILRVNSQMIYPID